MLGFENCTLAERLTGQLGHSQLAPQSVRLEGESKPGTPNTASPSIESEISKPVPDRDEDVLPKPVYDPRARPRRPSIHAIRTEVFEDVVMNILHGWPDSFRLENARLHMKGPA
ncbi:hypothetical protein HPB47_025117 [Ixodes persulcatus]|uniref:Uncharacterized protein n=1 Tax=Ixodes persulcatus TaxID=34615 RepID=A0AC60Q2D5_IXOPE|nr:hypothetical protein HPB47_025117 [Ixodes persulcatus]